MTHLYCSTTTQFKSLNVSSVQLKKVSVACANTMCGPSWELFCRLLLTWVISLLSLNTVWFLVERYYITFYLIAWAVSLSSVTLLHPRQSLKLFGIFLCRLIAQGLGQFYSNLGQKIRRGSTGSCKLNARGEKIGVFLSMSRFILKTVQDTTIVIIEDE